ncbi:hypothetical protein ACFQZE_10360 [Paenibacillus sp. GCM10027627]|uniref:hypothetical protein n=1 Tax=unclassified Paenibacillus TaxID=185978 RepID=UPI003641462F
MNRIADEDRQRYTDVSTVQSQRNDLASEEFPEGSYGSDLPSESLGKSSPWRIDAKAAKPFSYENHSLHAGLPRNYPGEDDEPSSIPEVQDEP